MDAPQYPDRKYIRWNGFDYTQSQNYFITIVVHERLHLLGEIYNGKMILNAAGKMVADVINETPNRYEKSTIVSSVVMPNHVHFIINNSGQHYVPEIIRWFKSITTDYYIKGVKNQGWQPFNKTFWQRNYYDRVIRDQQEYDRIVDYINNNPSKWANDMFCQ
ncbi:MAG: transposase [Alphaproteobacteria bacterium]